MGRITSILMISRHYGDGMRVGKTTTTTTTTATPTNTNANSSSTSIPCKYSVGAWGVATPRMVKFTY